MDNLVPPRMVSSEFTSFIAASMAIFETFPFIVFNVKIAPTFTKAGLDALPSELAQKQRIKYTDRDQTWFIVCSSYVKTKKTPFNWFINLKSMLIQGLALTLNKMTKT